MKKSLLKLAVIGALSVSAQAFATGLVAIPAVGFASSAYTSCNTTSNFGSSPNTISAPSAGANNTCAVFPINDATSPVAGYTLVASTTRQVFSGATNIGALVDRVWRNAAGNSCIFGARFTFVNGGFTVNDIARGGFSSSGDVTAGYYFHPGSNDNPVFRIGRSFTSVQHRALSYDTAPNKLLVGTNYVALPTIGGSTTLNINGENSPILSSTPAATTAAKQTAAINSNWVDFTIDSYFFRDQFYQSKLSPMLYVQAPCDSTNTSTWVKSGAIRLRQTAQEYENFNELSIDGYAPPGAVIP
jgi:hypothetical protein